MKRLYEEYEGADLDHALLIILDDEDHRQKKICFNIT
jgi:hypothetical protein